MPFKGHLIVWLIRGFCRTHQEIPPPHHHGPGPAPGFLLFTFRIWLSETGVKAFLVIAQYFCAES